MLQLSKFKKLQILTPTKLPKFIPNFKHIPEVYLNNQIPTSDNAENLKKIVLHPDVFAIQHPDIRLLQQAVTWQETYKLVDMTHRVHRFENFGSPDKPWKRNIGRTRRKDEKSAHSVMGTSRNAFSGPWSMWSEFNEDQQMKALISALTVKYAQNDLVIIDGTELKPANFYYSEQELAGQENYILTIIGDIIVPPEFVSESQYQNSLPVTGLNTLSILKHDKLHIHVSAIGKIQERLLSWGKRYPIGLGLKTFLGVCKILAKF